MGIRAWGSDGRSVLACTLMALFVSVGYAQDCGGLGEFCASYYNNKDLSGEPALTRIESEIQHEWGNDAPHESIRADRFSARYQGSFLFSAGEHVFTVTADDGVRVRLDGETVISAWVDQGPTTYTFETELVAGSHVIEVEYYDTWGGATLLFDWERVGGEPACDLPTDAFCAAYFDNMQLDGEPVLVLVEPAIQNAWGDGGPYDLFSDGFSARWRGLFGFEGGSYRFEATADDGVRLYVDGELAVDAWIDQAATTYIAELDLSPGYHEITMEYYEKWGGAHAQLDWARVVTGPMDCGLPVNSFCGSYYAGIDLEGEPLYTEQIGDINYPWGDTSHHPDIPDDWYSARWQGQFDFDAGLYQFNATADDGVRVWVSDELLIDGWFYQGATLYSGQIELETGRHNVVVEYFDGGWGAHMELNWSAVTDPEPNQPPTAMVLSPNTLAENQGLVWVGNIAVLDPDNGDQHQLSLVSGSGDDDNNAFVLDGAGLMATESFDHESSSSRRIRVRAEDGGGGVLEQSLTVIITNVNEQPLHIQMETARLTTDTAIGSAIGTLSADDPDFNDSFTFSLASGPGDSHNGLFSVGGDQILTAAGLSDLGGQALGVRLRVTDAGGAYQEAAFTLVVEAGPPPPPPGEVDRSPLGINISALNYWAREWPLVDVMKSAGGWYTQTLFDWDTGEQAALDVDSDGWVRSLPDANDPATYRYVAALMLFGSGGYHPAGQYTVLYEGEGEIQYFHDAVFNPALSQPGRHVLDINNPSDGGILLRITSTDPNGTGNHIRNIRVIMPGAWCGGDRFAYCSGQGDCGNLGCIPFEEGHDTLRFHPVFLENLRPYRAIRFMDYQNTNVVEIAGWDERTRPGHFSWMREAGGPLEIAVELCNALGADAWFNIPHKADDNHITRFAQLVRDNLNPDLKAYVEYGNEIWNTAFTAGNWVQNQAMAAWPQSNEDPYVKRMNWYGKRTTENAAIWKQIWGPQADRVVTVMGGFVANDWISALALDCPLWSAESGSPCSENIDVMAIAPYFGGYLGDQGWADEIAGWMNDADGGLNKLFEEMQQGGLLYDPNHFPEWERAPQDGAISQSRNFINRHFDLARAKGVGLVAYEGGQHLVGVGSQQGNSSLTDLFTAANRDPRMYQLYSEALAAWRDNGGQLFCQWLSVGAYSQWGSWGAKEHQTQENSPKSDALEDFIAANPCWWDGCERTVNR